jgi:hypothetical protein
MVLLKRIKAMNLQVFLIIKPRVMASISSRMQFLVRFVNIPPEMWDFIIPHGPKFSVATREYAMAGIVRDIALQLPDKALQEKLLGAGREMVGFASKGLINGWEDGDDICPPWPPFPFPWPGPYPPEPDPVPWLTARQENGLVYKAALKSIAKLTGVPAVAKQLEEIAGGLGLTGKANLKK